MCLSLFKKFFANKEQTENPNQNKNFTYKKKKYFMTKNEYELFNKLKLATQERQLIVQPQVNLATVIEKVGEYKYQNELYRNLDFCIFNKSYCPILAIELNDETHKQADRAKRDYKVREILKTAGLPLLTLYTDKTNEVDYIKKRIEDILG